MTGNSSALRKTQLETIQDGIVVALQDSHGAQYLIAIFPDQPEQFDMGNANQAGLIQYTGSRHSAPTGTGNGSQERRVEFAVHLYLRALGGSMRGAREIEQVRFALQGVKIQGADARS